MPKVATENFNKIKATLVARGSSLAGWARNHGYAVTTVWQAAHGCRAGKLSLEIKTKLESLIHAQR